MWELTTEKQTNEDGVSYLAYGLRCGEFRIADFSSVKEETERLIELMNRNEVSPVHALDVIEDYLGAHAME